MIPEYLQGDILSFDTETAVLGDKVCEIGFSLFRKTELVYEWSTFVNPGIPIDPEASKVHKIVDGDVENSPTFSEIVWVVYNTLNAADVLVAYNYDYDRSVLGKEFDRLGIKWPIKPVIDPFIFYKLWNKYSKGKKLINATEKYGIPYVGAHRAVNDATVTARLLFKMAAVRTDFPKDIKTLLKRQRVLIQEQFDDLQAYFTKMGKGTIDPPDYKFYDF